MKKVIIVIILFVFLTGFTGCSKKQTSNTPINPNPQEQAKVVKIDSDPKGATVFIDNDDPVETPVEYKLTFGTHFVTFRKAGYYDVVKKDVDVNEDTTSISVTLKRLPTEEEMLIFSGIGPIAFDSGPYIACCSAAAVAYSNIFYGETRTISGLTTLESFDLVFPSRKKVHFNIEKEKVSDYAGKFSKVVTFDELGNYEITLNGKQEYSFEVCYRAKIVSKTPTLEDIFPDYYVKNAIAVSVGKEVEARLLITDTKGNPIRNKPLGVYDLKTDENGIVTFKVKIERKECEYCYVVYVNGKPAQVRVYADILVWGYDFIRFSKGGHLIESSFPGIKSDVKVKIQDENVYMPRGSFGLKIADMYPDSGSRENNIISHPKDSSVIYTDGFVSKDSGLHWEKLSLSFDTIAVDPHKPNVLYGWSEINPYNISALFKSEDYGLHFAKIEDIEFVRQIVVDPNDSNTLYLATYKGLFKSNDGGKTWDHMVDPRSGNVEFVAVSPENSNVVLVSTGMGLFKSEDRGKTWKKISLVKDKPPEWNIPNCIVFDPANPSTIYAGTDYGLFISRDDGENWKKLGMFELLGNRSIAIDPTSLNKIYIVSYGDGIYKSEDYGEHFTKIDFPFSFVTDIGITVNNLGELLVNDGIPFKLSGNGNFIPLGGDTFLKNGPKWKIIDGQFYIAVNTIKSDLVRVIITDDTIEFYKVSDMIL